MTATYKSRLDRYIQVNEILSSREESLLRCANLAENLSLTFQFPRNSNMELGAVAESFHYVSGSTPFLVHATYLTRNQHWRVKTSAFYEARGRGPHHLDGTVNVEWRKGHTRTAFTYEQLARHARNSIRAHPFLYREGLVAIF